MLWIVWTTSLCHTGFTLALRGIARGGLVRNLCDLG